MKRSLFFAVAVLATVGTASATRYLVTDLGTLGGASSRARAVNDKGEVVGESFTSDGKGRHAFLWREGKMIDLGTLGEVNSIALGINDAGRVVGVAYSPHKKGQPAIGVEVHFRAALGQVGPLEDQMGTPFQWVDGEVRRLGSAGLTGLATAINAAGSVAGFTASVGKGKTVVGGFEASEAGTSASLPPQGWHWMPCALNSRGEMVGQLQAVGRGWAKAAAFIGGRFVTLTTPASTDLSTASGINDSGRIVGWTGGKSKCTAWVWDGGALTDLGTLGGPISLAYAINNAGFVVGASALPSGAGRGFVAGAGGMFDLNGLVDGGRWTITEATGISAKGFISATGTDGKASHALLLTPIE